MSDRTFWLTSSWLNRQQIRNVSFLKQLILCFKDILYCHSVKGGVLVKHKLAQTASANSFSFSFFSRTHNYFVMSFTITKWIFHWLHYGTKICMCMHFWRKLLHIAVTSLTFIYKLCLSGISSVCDTMFIFFIEFMFLLCIKNICP